MSLYWTITVCFVSWIHYMDTAAGFLGCLAHLTPGRCQEGNATDGYHFVTCADSGPVNLTCPPGYTIQIQSAFWGRPSQAHCNNEGSGNVKCLHSFNTTSLPCQGKETQCLLPLRNNNESNLLYRDKCTNHTVTLEQEKFLFMDLRYNCRAPERSSDISTPMLTTSVVHTSSDLTQTESQTRVKEYTHIVTTHGKRHANEMSEGDSKNSLTTTSEDMKYSASQGGANIGIGIGVGVVIIVLIVICVIMFLWWRRRPRNKYVKEEEAVYLPTHPDDVAPPSPNTNLTNPTYGQQNSETHEYDYANVELDADAGGSVNQFTDPHYTSVNEKTIVGSNGLSTSETPPGDVPKSPQYETVYPDKEKYIYDAEYGAVDFIENDLYDR